MAYANINLQQSLPGCLAHQSRSPPIGTARLQQSVRLPRHEAACQRGRKFIVAAEKSDEGFEGRLSKLKGKGGKKEEQQETPRQALEAARKEKDTPKYDFADEELYFETPPHRGDLATNVILGATVLWLPLTIASVARAAFVKYRFTTLRLSVTTKAPGRDEQLDAAYQEIKEVQSVGRGWGQWGDMVITLRSGDKVELRALPRYREMEEYILRRRDELRPAKYSAPKASPAAPASKGF